MSPLFRKFALVLSIWIITSLACASGSLTPIPETTDATKTADAQIAQELGLEVHVMELDDFMSVDEKIVFSYAGENQSYHTGLRNRTVFKVSYYMGRVKANEEASFEESAGTDMTRRGTDSVKFDGVYFADKKMISGDYFLYTQGLATGGSGNYDNTLTYKLDGRLTVRLVDGQWLGTVRGTSTLTQVWPGGEQDKEVTTHDIIWDVIGIPEK